MTSDTRLALIPSPLRICGAVSHQALGPFNVQLAVNTDQLVCDTALPTSEDVANGGERMGPCFGLSLTSHPALYSDVGNFSVQANVPSGPGRLARCGSLQ